MTNKKTDNKRRQLLKNISVTALSATASIMATGALATSGKKSRSAQKSESDPVVIIQNAKDHFSISSQKSRSSEEPENKAGEIENLVNNQSSNDEIEQAMQKFDREYRTIVYNLMGTQKYSHQTLVDMKFVLQRVQQEMSHLTNSLKTRSIEAAKAEQALNTATSNFLTNLEQLPLI